MAPRLRSSLSNQFWFWLLFTQIVVGKEALRGPLDTDLHVPAHVHQVTTFSATNDRRSYPDLKLAEEDKLYTGRVRGSAALVVERHAHATRLFVDTNRDGRLLTSEEQDLRPTEDALLSGIAMVRFPLSGPGPRHYPVLVYVYRQQRNSAERLVGESPRAFLRGRVNIGMRAVIVNYEFDPERGAGPRYGWQGMDIDGDGNIDQSPGSLEYVRAENEEVVFRIGEHYLSTSHIDLTRGEFVLQFRSRTQYTRIELRPGTLVPDFAFRDFTSRSRSLNEFAGRWVMLDFWATWCAPCRSELPRVRQAQHEFRDHGLVVLGMNADEDLERARKMLAELNIDYPNATWDSIQALTERRFRIGTYPTHILIDPNRRIVSVDAKNLSGERLLPYLRTILVAPGK